MILMTNAEGISTEQTKEQILYRLGPYENMIDNALKKIESNQTMDRIWKRDFTVWKPQPKDIKNRLGWLNAPEKMLDKLEEMEVLAEDLRSEGYRYTVLLGMGGSSLAPEVFGKLFGIQKGYPELIVLDSVNPDAISACMKKLDPLKTLFVVSTKSGDTVETISLFKYCYRWICDELGDTDAGRHFVAITDCGSRLEAYAKKFQFRGIFLNDPEIGGRFSALSYFGLLPAILGGIDANKLLDGARAAIRDCRNSNDTQNPAARLGAALGALALCGRDKLTFFLPPAIAGFGDWLEQLIAESTGKEGKGILPVIGESPGSPQAYGNDRLFVQIRFQETGSHNPDLADLEKLIAAGHPVIEMKIEDPYDIGYHFFLWELAVAVAGAYLGINPFDQPDVESAKVLAREMISDFLETCALPSEAPITIGNGISVYGHIKAASPEEALNNFLKKIQPGDYVAIQAFIAPSDESDRAILELRMRIRDRFLVATTSGYGPRYLHSTGQLHKGDRGNGLFLQLTANHSKDISIPDEPDTISSSVTFGILKTAQALGDKKALLNAGRRVLHFDLGTDIQDGLHKLVQAV